MEFIAGLPYIAKNYVDLLTAMLRNSDVEVNTVLGTDMRPGDVRLWSKGEVKKSPEEIETPAPVVFGPVLAFMKIRYEEARTEYFQILVAHVGELLSGYSKFKAILESDLFVNRFVPRIWTGIQGFPPLDLQIKEDFPPFHKISKSWFGFSSVKFFDYKETYGKREMDADRKKAIMEFQMPTCQKEMKNFLGAALFFFKSFVPNYSGIAAEMNKMTHKDFNWNRQSWTYDYKGDFNKMKLALSESVTKLFPKYNMDWVLRVDASDNAVGAVLYQERPDEFGVGHETIVRLTAKGDLPCETGDISEASERNVWTSAEMFKEVHGGRKLHWGSRRTWQALNKRFPGHGISFRQIEDMVAKCPICQKDRLGLDG
eukprot:gene36332-biopygen2425